MKTKITNPAKEKADYIMCCKIFEMASIIIMILLLFLAGMFTVGIITDIKRISEPIYYWNTSYEIIGSLFSAIALKYSADIFRNLKKGDTPFCKKISDKIKKAGIILVFGGVICFFIEIIGETVLHENINSELVSYHISIIGAGLCLLSYIFNYGIKLQQENDDTV